jgi:8-oxo-dGTP pyrophosphatase MutT (NUDIX family)
VESVSREAAVAVIRLVEPHSGLGASPDPHYLILRRAVSPLDPWSGHFAFPGGRRDPDDPSLLAACYRETREECGLDLGPARLVATLPVTEAGNALGRPVRVTPYLFELSARPVITLDPRECAASHWVSQTHLRDPLNHGFIAPLPGSDRRFPGVRLHDGHIWGFTYQVLMGVLGD